MTIEPGSQVLVRAAGGEALPRRAVSGIERGLDFPVVWVCQQDEWEAAQSEDRDPEAVPWPAEDVTPATDEQDENEIAFRVVEEATDDDAALS